MAEGLVNNLLPDCPDSEVLEGRLENTLEGDFLAIFVYKTYLEDWPFDFGSLSTMCARMAREYPISFFTASSSAAQKLKAHFNKTQGKNFDKRFGAKWNVPNQHVLVLMMNGKKLKSIFVCPHVEDIKNRLTSEIINLS